jgi:hypothetical protein
LYSALLLLLLLLFSFIIHAQHHYLNHTILNWSPTNRSRRLRWFEKALLVGIEIHSINFFQSASAQFLMLNERWQHDWRVRARVNLRAHSSCHALLIILFHFI